MAFSIKDIVELILNSKIKFLSDYIMTTGFFITLMLTILFFFENWPLTAKCLESPYIVLPVGSIFATIYIFFALKYIIKPNEKKKYDMIDAQNAEAFKRAFGRKK